MVQWGRGEGGRRRGSQASLNLEVRRLQATRWPGWCLAKKQQQQQRSYYYLFFNSFKHFTYSRTAVDC